MFEMKQITFAIALCFAAFGPSAHASGWTLFNQGHPWNWLENGREMNSPGGETHINTTGAPKTITGTYSYIFYLQVTGSNDTTPPWTGPFSGLINWTTTVTRNYSKSLRTGYQGTVYDKLTVSEGAQTWVKPGNLAKRERLVYTLVEAMFLEEIKLDSNGSDPD
jgi:hypothetical protein